MNPEHLIGLLLALLLLGYLMDALLRPEKY
jgi:K+-transporting ATPase KdpF subunit